MFSYQLKTLSVVFLSIASFNQYAYSADIAAGKSKANLCLGCHGINGNSTNPEIPILADQQRTYLQNQLKAFKSGQRSNSIMENIASQLSVDDIQNIAAFFASVESNNSGGDLKPSKSGKNKVARCLGCHGNSAQGNGSFPKLAGQHPNYLKKQLLDFKNKIRIGGPMNTISRSLSSQDIDEISTYLSNL